MIKLLKNKKIYISNISLLILAILYYLVFSLPMILGADFYADDKLLIYYASELLNKFQKNFFQEALEQSKVMFHSGRVYGLYLTHFLIYKFFSTTWSFYVIKVVFNFLAVLSIAWFVILFTKNKYNGWFFVFLMPLFFLHSISIDPLLSQGLSTQICCIYIALTCCFYILKVEKNNKFYSILAFICYFFSYFHYEIGISIVPIMVILAVRFREVISKEKNFKKNNYLSQCIKVSFHELRYYHLLFLLWAGLCCYFRYKSQISYDGVLATNNFKIFLLGWLAQILSGLPFGNYYHEFYHFSWNFDQIISGFFVFLLSFLVFQNLLTKINFKNYYRDLILIGLVIILVSSGIISLSKKYSIWSLADKHRISFVQIFLQFMGGGILIMCFASYSMNNALQYTSYFRYKLLKLFFSIIFSVAIVITMNLNYSIIENKNSYEIYGRKTLTKSFKTNIFDQIIKAQGGLNNDVMQEDYYNSYYLMGYENYELCVVKKQSNEICNQYNDKIKFLISNLDVFHSSFFSYFINITPYLSRHRAFLSNNIKEDLENFYIIFSKQSSMKRDFLGFIMVAEIKNIKMTNQNNLINYEHIIKNPKIFFDKDYIDKIQTTVDYINKIFAHKVIDEKMVKKIIEDMNKTEIGVVVDINKDSFILQKEDS